MKTLTKYKRNGIEWNIINRINNIAVAESERGYEVIIVQSHNGRTIAGNYCEPAEYPPSNEQWGSKGWSYSLLVDANEKFNTLTK
jgi:hypothetical protein